MRFFKKILFVFLSLLLLLGTGIVYLNTIFLPFQAKDVITSKAKELLKRDVFIGEMIFLPAKGLVLKDIRISEKNNSTLPFVSIKEININVVLPDIFHTGHIFIPSINIQSPIVHFYGIVENEWNFSDLFTSPKKNNAKPPAKSKTVPQKSFLSLGAVDLHNGQFIISNQSLTETIEVQNANITFDFPDSINFNGDFTIPAYNSTFNSKGKFLLTSKELTAVIAAHNLNPSRLLNLTGMPLDVVFDKWLLTYANLTLRWYDDVFILAGSLLSPIDIRTKTDTLMRAQGTVISKNFIFQKKGHNFNLTGNFVAPKTTITIGDDKTFSADFSSTHFHFQKTDNQYQMTGELLGQKALMSFANQTLNGEIELKKIAFDKQGPAFSLGAESKITNTIFKNSAWDIATSTSQAKWNLNHNETGLNLNILNFSAQNLAGIFLKNKLAGNATGQNIQIKLSDDNFNAQGHFITQNFNISFPNQLTFLGNPQFDLTLTRNSQMDAGKIDHKAMISFDNDTLQGIPKVGEIKNIKGQLNFSEDNAASQNLTLTVAETDLSLSGKVQNFNAPHVQATVTAKDFNVSVDGTYNAKIINLTQLQGQYHDSTFDLKGNIDLKEGSPDIDLNGIMGLSLSDLTLIPGVKDALKPIFPIGIINFTGHYKLAALDWKKISLNAKATAAQISLYGFAFTDLSADLKTLSDNSQTLKLNSVILGGKLSLETTLDLAETNIPSQVSINLAGVNLAKISETLPDLKDKTLAGFLSATTKFSGPLLDNKNLEGDGTIAIIDGKLLELEMFKGIWKILFSNLLVSDYRKIVFTQGKASFTIAKGRIATKDLIIKSIPADISARGSAGFDYSLNFDIVAKVRDAPLVSASALQAVPTTIFSQVVKNVIGIKLKGTVTKPQIQYRVLPIQVLEKTTGSVFQGIQGMMEDLWKK